MDVRRRISLPFEIDEYVFDHLDLLVDRETILNCALLNHTWLSITRRKLYRDVIIMSRRKWDLFERTLRLSQEYSLGGGIHKNLMVAHTLMIGPPANSPGERHSSSWAHEVFFRCAEFMPAIRCMIISRVLWEPPHLSALQGLYPLLTTFCTSRCSFRDINHVNALVSAFPALTKLFLGVETIIEAGASLQTDQRTLLASTEAPRLELLEIRCHSECVVPLSSWLVDVGWPLQNLITFQWKPNEPMYLEVTYDEEKNPYERKLDVLPFIVGSSRLKNLQLTLCQTPSSFDP